MNEKVFDTFPELETTRMLLREAKLEDAAIVFECNSTLEYLKYIARDPFTSIEQAENKINEYKKWFSEHTCVMFKFIEKETNKPVGYGGIFNISKTAGRGELGYITLKDYWGNGFASEAVKEIIEFGFKELQLNKIYAVIDPGNIGSKKVVEKFGFEVEGLFKQQEYAQGKYFDLLSYALFND